MQWRAVVSKRDNERKIDGKSMRIFISLSLSLTFFFLFLFFSLNPLINPLCAGFVQLKIKFKTLKEFIEQFVVKYAYIDINDSLNSIK